MKYYVSTKMNFTSWFNCGKKMLALRWKPLHSLTMSHWLNLYVDVDIMELSVARMHAANESTILSWTRALNRIQELL